MGKDIIIQNVKVAKAERRFFRNIDELTDDVGDNGVRFSLEMSCNGHDYSFFNNGLLRQSFDEEHCFEDLSKHAADEKRIIYWESQESLLQEILDEYHSTCSKIREQIKRNIAITKDSIFCNCSDITSSRDCYNCLRVAAVDQLRRKGFNAFLCTSKWPKTHNTLGGKHDYIEVIATTQRRNKPITLLVELGFSEEFKMAKACDEYDQFIRHLPEIYVGKIEHLNAIVKLTCDAAKKSAEKQRIHIGPWRKRSYMQMKWSASFANKRFVEDRRSIDDSSSRDEWSDSVWQF